MSIHIQISEGTQKNMAILDIKEFPFSEEVLKAKYREAAMKHHPDKGGAANDFINIKNAFENLKIFASISLNKEGFMNSTKKKMEVLRPGFIWDNCRTCSGKGFIPLPDRTEIVKCDNCKGTGKFTLLCRSCKGTGRHSQNGKKTSCRTCNGKGVYKQIDCNVCNTPRLKWLRQNHFRHFDFIPQVGFVEKKIDAGNRQCNACEGTGKYQREQLNPVLRSGSLS